MREKLIELIGQVQDEGRDYSDVVCVYPTSNKRLADHIIANGVTIPVRCKDCKRWLKDFPGCTDAIGRCEWANYMIGANGYCVYGERKGDGNDNDT